MRIWIVYTDYIDEVKIIRAFNTEEKAKQFCQENDSDYYFYQETELED